MKRRCANSNGEELRKSVWVRADFATPWTRRKRLVSAAIEAGADAVIVKPEEAKAVKELGAIKVVADRPATGVDTVMLEASSAAEVKQAVDSLPSVRKRVKEVALRVEIADKATEREALMAGKKVDFLVAVGRDWKIIPLENLIAKLYRAGVKILAGIRRAEEARTAVETLEIGADGVMLDAGGRVGEVKRVCEVLEELAVERLELAPARVTLVKPVGMGDRACVDTTSLLSIGEGMLVGSQAGGLFLVHSETLPSKFVEPRPFRVNAGPVHAYIRLPAGKTKYLSELKAGDEVLVVNARGVARSAVVGRVKIERRPLLLIEARCKGESLRTLVQNAETINLVSKAGKPVSVVKLKPGDEVLVHLERVGRHFGVEVEETIVER